MTTPPARRLAVDALLRIDDGAWANLVVPALLDGAHLPARDRAFVTELVYGTTRMRRACDWLVSRHLNRAIAGLDGDVRAALRLGAYQLAFLHTPPHAAVSATVDVTPLRARGLVNAVLRKVAADADAPPWPDALWPDDGTRLSYPDWIVERLTVDLGADAAGAALTEMNRAAEVSVRPDGYVQDRASQWVGHHSLFCRSICSSVYPGPASGRVGSLSAMIRSACAMRASPCSLGTGFGVE